MLTLFFNTCIWVYIQYAKHSVQIKLMGSLGATIMYSVWRVNKVLASWSKEIFHVVESNVCMV